MYPLNLWYILQHWSMCQYKVNRVNFWGIPRNCSDRCVSTQAGDIAGGSFSPWHPMKSGARVKAGTRQEAGMVFHQDCKPGHWGNQQPYIQTSRLQLSARWETELTPQLVHLRMQGRLYYFFPLNWLHTHTHARIQTVNSVWGGKATRCVFISWTL